MKANTVRVLVVLSCVVFPSLVFTQHLAGAPDTIALRVKPGAAPATDTFPSLTAARDAIREHRAKGEWKAQAIVVQLEAGAYYLDEPFTLGPGDGGSKERSVTYTAKPNNQVTISGGKVITGFKPVEVDNKKLWAVEIPEVKSGKWYFRQLFVNNQRRPRTRLPKEGFYRFADTAVQFGQPGQMQGTFTPGDLKKWDNLQDVDIIALHLWAESHLPIAELDEAGHVVKFAAKSVYSLADGGSGGNLPARYYVENVFEALDTPGQWYLNRTTGTLYYLPKEGETPENVTVIAPRLSQLVRVEGRPGDGQAVSGIRFDGLTFRHAEWSLPAGNAGDVQAAFSVPGAVYLAQARHCALLNCRVEHVSSYAVEFGAGCSDCSITNSELSDLGGGGVKLGHDSTRTIVADNAIGPGGKIYHSAVGVWIGNSGENQVLHNEIHDLLYTGVSVGWSWGYEASKAVKNAVEYNHIYNIGAGVISDMGGIYTLGVSPGTTLRYNHIHDVVANPQGYGGWGIYNDQGSSGILIENNLVYRTSDGSYHHHYGKENQVRNNIFADAKSAQLVRSKAEEHTSFFFDHNIVYFTEGTLLISDWSNDHYAMDNNVYWRAGGKPFDFAGASFEDWKKRGHDEHSVIADPLFADPARGDFALKPDSPALKLGFKPIETKGIGRTKSAAGKAE